MNDTAKSSAITKDTPFPRQFAREVLTLTRGKGSYLWDSEGTRYLDLGAGIAVNALGYGDRKLARIIGKQAQTLLHTSNLYATPQNLEFGRDLLATLAPYGREPFAAVHFGNSGSEANEAAIKYARLYARHTRGEGEYRIIAFEKAFHGRTLGALSATPTKKYRTKFEPLLKGFTFLPFNDVDALRKDFDTSVAAIIVENVQGEGGLNVISPEFARALNEITRDDSALLIADEVQTGLGRVGTLLASRKSGLAPDVVTLSKPLAAGLPLSATLIPARVNNALEVGDHGTTFGGGPLTTLAANYVLNRITAPGFLESVNERAALLERELATLLRSHAHAVSLCGQGMLRGVVLADNAPYSPSDVMSEARKRGVLVLRSGANVIRIAPPLTIKDSEIKRGVAILNEALDALEA